MKAFFRMEPPAFEGISIGKDFEVKLFWGQKELKPNFLPFEEMVNLAPFHFEGTVDDDGNIDFTYKHNRKKISKHFNLFLESDKERINYNIFNLKYFKERFLTFDEEGELSEIRKPQSGGFIFFFYAYDWRNPSEGLKSNEKLFIKENSVFLYRDNIRVFPYGEKGVDWLSLSKYRAEDRAGFYFSYNDLIGFIFITHEENPELRDAADREGLMNINGIYDDFVAQIQAVLKVMKDEVDIDKKIKQLKEEKPFKSLDVKFQNAYITLQKEVLKEKQDKEAVLSKAKSFFQATNNLVERAKEQVKITQELAGTGMAVEKATHDTMSLLKRLRENANDFIKRFRKDKVSPDELADFLQEVEESLEFLYQELQVLQPLFRVARKVTKNVSVKEVAKRVQRYFRKELSGNIQVNMECENDVVVRTNTGLILQVLLNLMDNSIYWLNQSRPKDKKILIDIDGINNRIVFSDNGIGISDDIKDVIFSEFYSKKDEGRGLGFIYC